MHKEAHELAGKTVRLKTAAGSSIPTGNYRIEDWWDRVSGSSWMFSKGNPACLKYAVRSGEDNLPIDDEVVYGKIGYFGHLVHVSELDKVVE